MNEGIKQLIEVELDKRNLSDIAKVMSTDPGRRFIQWLIMKCGQNETSFTRDSRTYFNEGMRNAALLIEASIKAIGMNGVDLLHKAEKEYIITQEDIKRQILKKGGDKSGEMQRQTR